MDNKEVVVVVVVDLSKVFDDINYSFLFVKLKVYGFFIYVLELMFIYLLGC